MLPELLHPGSAVALGELFSVGAKDHSEVGEDRDWSAQRAKERDVLRRVGKVVDAADDVRDPHVHVVHDDAEVVERVAVRADEDEVVEGARRELGAPLHDVVHDDRLVRHAEAEDELLARRSAPVGLLLRNRAAGAGVPELRSRRPGGSLHRLQLLGRLEGAVGLALDQELLRRLAVEALPLALEERPLIPRKAEPRQGVGGSASVSSLRLRSTSVSSMRRMNAPPWRRAKSQL